MTLIPAHATIQPVGTARKPVIVRKWTRDWCAGYTTSEFSDEFPYLELLDNSGKLVQIPWDSVKWVCYVREMHTTTSSLTDKDNPERILRRRFASRPRIAGLWLRLTLMDGEELEGIAANDRSLVEGRGVLLTPPDTRSNTQRVLVPKSSIRELTVLGVVVPPSSSRRIAEQAELDSQPKLFDTESDAEISL